MHALRRQRNFRSCLLWSLQGSVPVGADLLRNRVLRRPHPVPALAHAQGPVLSRRGTLSSLLTPHEASPCVLVDPFRKNVLTAQ